LGEKLDTNHCKYKNKCKFSRLKKIDVSDGVFVCAFSYFLNSCPDILSDFFGSKENIESEFNNSIVLFVSSGTKVSKTLDLSTACSLFQEGLPTDIIVVLESGSALNLYDNISSYNIDEKSVKRSIKCFLKPGSQLQFIHNQNLSKEVDSLSCLNFYLQRESRLDFFGLFDGGVINNSVEVFLMGRRCYFTTAIFI